MWGRERQEKQSNTAATAKEYPTTTIHSRTLSERSLNSRSGSSRVREKGTVCLRHKEEAVGKITYMCQKCVEAGKHGVL